MGCEEVHGHWICVGRVHDYTKNGIAMVITGHSDDRTLGH